MTDVLAVDGGQSTIRLLHSGSPAVVEVGGVSRQEGDIVSAVAVSIGNGWRKLGSPSIQRAVVGLTTAPSEEQSADRLCALISETTGAPEIWLTDDAVTAGIGALSGKPGVSLIAGTGVACLAVPHAQTPRVFGGYGYLLGDEGGGYWIGRRGLGAVLRSAEKRGPATVLTELASSRYGAIDQLHVRIHDSQRAIHQIASFAPDVLSAAYGGDDVASAIVDEAAWELATVVRAAVEWMGSGSVDVALGGRLLGGANELAKRLEGRLKRDVPGASVREAAGSPLDGAIALGRQSDPGRYASLVRVWGTRTAP